MLVFLKAFTVANKNEYPVQLLLGGKVLQTLKPEDVSDPYLDTGVYQALLNLDVQLEVQVTCLLGAPDNAYNTTHFIGYFLVAIDLQGLPEAHA